jgi:hypothetical protein
MTLNNGVILDLENNPTLNATSIVFGNTAGNTTAGTLQLEGISGTNTSPYTIAAGTTLSGNLAGIGTTDYINGNASQLTNQGSILLSTSGLTTQIGGGNLNSFTNASGASLQATNGNNLSFQGVTLTNNAGATIQVLNGGTLTTNVGMTNHGILTAGGSIGGALVNTGAVNPGSGGPGTLTVTGNYTQSAAGALGIELGGYTQGIQYDLLKIGGAASLNGTLNISLINNFTPLVGDTFEIVDYASHDNNVFSNISSAANGVGYTAIYNGADLLLQVTQSPIVSWIATTSGDWSLAANWSSNPNLPGPANTVVNNTNFTITHSADNDSIARFTSTGAFNLTGGSLNIGQSIQVNNTFTLNGGDLIGGSLLTGTGGQGLTVAANTANELNGVTALAALDLSQGGFLRFNNGALNGGAILGNGAILVLQGAPTLGSSLTFNGGGSASDLRLNGNTTLTIGNGLSLTGVIGDLGGSYDMAGAATLNNAGAITLNIANNTTTLDAASFTNSGTLSVSNGAGLILKNTTAANTGTFTVTGGPLALTNSTLTNTGAFSIAGGTLNITNSTLTGGTVSVTTGVNFSTDTANTLQNVTLNANLTLANGGFARITGGSLNSQSIALDNAAKLVLNGSQSLTGAKIAFGNGGGHLYLDGGTTLTLDAASQISGKIGTIGDNYSLNGAGTVVNGGQIVDAVSGDTLTLAAARLNNSGTLEAMNGANLTLNGETATNSGALEVLNGGAFTLTHSTLTNTGTLTLAGSPLTLINSTLTTPGALNPLSLALTGSTLNNANLALTPVFTGANTLGGVTLNAGSLDLSNGQTLIVNGGSLTANSLVLDNGAALVIQGSPTLTVNTITFGNNGQPSNLDLDAPNQAASLTLGAGATLSGRIGTLGAIYSGNGASYARTLINQGTILSNVAGNTTTIAADSFTNDNLVEAANGANLTLGDGATNAASGTVSLTGGGTLTLTGNVTNQGSITLDGTLALNNAVFTNNGSAINTPNLTVSGSTLRNGSLSVTNTPTFAGNNALDGATLTAPQLNLTGNTLSLLNAPTINAGQIALSNGATLRLAGAPTLNVTSLVFGSGGGSIALESNVAYTLGSGTTLSGDIVNLGGPSQTSGVGSSLTNLGTITLNTANTTTLGAAGFSNAGTVDISGTSTLSANTDYDQTGGLTTVDGALLLNGHTLNLNGGTLNGMGTITGALVNAATVSPGHAPGILSITGNYTQAAAGTLDLTINGDTAGTQYSRLNVSGATSLAGTLNVSFGAGFHPLLGDSLDILNYGSYSGGFTNLLGNNGFAYTLAYNANDLLLTISQTPYGVYWIKTSNGDWDEAQYWNKDGSTGTLPGATDDVINNTVNTLTHSTGSDTIQSFLSKGQFDLTGGVLGVTGTVQVNNTFTLDGGTLKNATVLPGSGGQGLTITSNTNNLLDGVTLNVLLDLTNGGYVRLANGITLNAGATVDTQSTLDLNGGTFDPTTEVKAGGFSLAGTLRNGTLAHADSLSLQPGATLQNITLANPLDLSGFALNVRDGLTGQVNLNNSSRLYLTDSQTLQNFTVQFGPQYNQTNSPSASTWNYLSVEGGSTVTLGSGLSFTGPYVYLSSNLTDPNSANTLVNAGVFSVGGGQTALIGNTMPVNAGGGMTLVNNAAATLQANGGTLVLQPTFLNNLATSGSGGMIGASSQGHLYVDPANWTEAGYIVSDGVNTRVYLGGGAITLDNPNDASQNLRSKNGGEFFLTTTLDNTNHYFDAVQVNGLFHLQGGTIQGGLVNSTTSLLRFDPGYNNVLDNVTLTKLLPGYTSTLAPGNLSGLDLSNGGWAHIEGTLTSNGVFALDNGAQLTFNGDRTFQFDPSPMPATQPADFQVGAGAINMDANATLTLSDESVVTANNLELNSNDRNLNQNITLVNNIALTSGSGFWRINADTLNNATHVPSSSSVPYVVADISAINSASMLLNVGTLNNQVNSNDTFSNAALIEARNGGILALQANNYAAFGHIQAYGSGAQVHYLGGVLTLTGGPITFKDGLSDYQDTMRAYSGGVNVLDNTLDLGHSAQGYMDLNVATNQIAGNLEVQGGAIRGGVINSTSPYLTFDHAGEWNEPGVGGVLYSYSTLDNVILNDGTLNPDGTPNTSTAHLAGLNLNNGGWVQIVNAPAAPWTNDQFQLSNDAHLMFVSPNVAFGPGDGPGGTNNTAAFTFGNSGTLAAASGSNITFDAGTTLTGGGINVAMSGGNLTVNSGASISGSSVSISNTGSGNLTFNSGATVTGGTLSISGGVLNNNITLNAGSGQSYSIAPGALNNYAVLEATGGGQMSVAPGVWNTIGSIQSNGAGSVVTLGGGAIPNDNSSAANGLLNSQLQASGGGQFVLSATINNNPAATASGAFVDPTAIGSNLIFNYGAISGGRLNTDTPVLSPALPAGTHQVVFNNNYVEYPAGFSDNMLENVTLKKMDGSTPAGLDLTNGGTVTITGTLNGGSMVTNTLFDLNNNARLTFYNNNAMTLGAGTVVNFNQSGTINPYGATLTLAGGVNLMGVNATVGAWDGYQPPNVLVNQTLIASQQGGAWTVAPFSLDSGAGVIEAVRGSTLILAPQQVTALGVVQAGEMNALAGSSLSTIYLGRLGFSNAVITATPGAGPLPFSAYSDGQIILAATLNLNGHTLDSTNLGGGKFIIQGGTLQNGFLVLPDVTLPPSANTTNIQFAAGYTDTLNNMTLQDSGGNPVGLDLTSGFSVRITGTLDGDLTNVYQPSSTQPTFLLDNGASVSFDGDRTFNGAWFAVGNNHSPGGYSGYVNVDGTLTLEGNTKITDLTGVNPALSFALSAGTLDNFLTLGPSVAGAQWSISAGTLNNNATIQALSGGVLSLAPNVWGKVGSLLAAGAGSKLYLGGGPITLQQGDSIVAQNGGENVLVQTPNMPPTRLELGGPYYTFLNPDDPSAQIHGTFVVNGGRIDNGVINSNAANLQLPNAILDAVTLASSAANPLANLTGLTLNQGQQILLLQSLTSSSQFSLDQGASLTFGSRIQPWSFGTGTGNSGGTSGGASFQFGAAGGTLDVWANNSLDLEPGATVAGSNAVIGTYYRNGDPANGYGTLNIGDTVSLDANNTQWIIGPGTLVNNGLIQSTNGGAMIVNPASWGAAGQIQALGAGANTYLGYNGYWPYLSGAITLADSDQFAAKNGGTLWLETELNLGATGQSGAFIGLDSAAAGNQVMTDNASTFEIYGGRIDGGRLNAASNTLIFSPTIPAYLNSTNFNYRDNVLDNVTLTDASGTTLAGLDLRHGGWVHIVNNLFSNNTFLLDNDAHLVLESDRTFGAGGQSASFTFGSTGANTIYLTGGSTLLLNDGVTLTGTNANIGAASPYQPGATTLVSTMSTANAGQGLASLAGGVWSLTPTLLENDGVFTADHASTLNLGVSGGTFLNNNLTQALNASAINVNASSVVNNGAITLTNSALTFNNSTIANASGSTITVTGAVTGNTSSGSFTLNNSTFTNHTGLNGIGILNLSNADATLNNSTLNNYPDNLSINVLHVNGSTVNDGALNVSNTAYFNGSTANYFNAVTFTANNGIDLSNGGYLRINNGTTNLASSPGVPTINLANGGNLDLNGSIAFANPPDIEFGNSPGGIPGLLHLEAGAILDLPVGSVAEGKIGDIGGNETPIVGARILTNEGTINSDVAGNIGTIDPTQFTNTATGLLEVTNGGGLTLNTPGQTPINQGSLIVGAGSVFTLTQGLDQKAGQTTVDGTLNTPNASLLIEAGKLNGVGAITGNVDNQGGTVAPGHSPGMLTITGNYTQSAASLLDIELGGTTAGAGYSQLKVSGLAQLAGNVDVHIVNGFAPTLGETFDILTYGSYTGGFNQILSFDSGYDYTVDYSAPGTAKLVVTAAAAVPEMSTLVTAGLMLGAGGLLLRRRSRALDTSERAA